MGIGLVAVLVVTLAAGAYYVTSSEQRGSENLKCIDGVLQSNGECAKEETKEEQTIDEEVAEEMSPQFSTSVSTPTPIPTPTPTPTPEPPKMRISYPKNGQSLEFTSSQTLCVVDVPDGDNTSGLMRRQNINGSGWNGYQTHFTLYYSPSEGSNTLQWQYKNSFGQESEVYSINFTFSKI